MCLPIPPRRLCAYLLVLLVNRLWFRFDVCLCLINHVVEHRDLFFDNHKLALLNSDHFGWLYWSLVSKSWKSQHCHNTSSENDLILHCISSSTRTVYDRAEALSTVL